MLKVGEIDKKIIDFAQFKSWLDAFSALRKLLAQKIEKSAILCILFIDELPCLDTLRSGFIKALGYFWNSWASKQDKIKLIVCGSATSWMIDNIINAKGSLHNRITCEIKYGDSSYFITKEEDEKMCNRLAKFKMQTGTRCALWPTFITTFGLADNMYAKTIPAQAVLDDLFDD